MVDTPPLGDRREGLGAERRDPLTGARRIDFPDQPSHLVEARLARGLLVERSGGARKGTQLFSGCGPTWLGICWADSEKSCVPFRAHPSYMNRYRIFAEEPQELLAVLAMQTGLQHSRRPSRIDLTVTLFEARPFMHWHESVTIVACQ